MIVLTAVYVRNTQNVVHSTVDTNLMNKIDRFSLNNMKLEMIV